MVETSVIMATYKEDIIFLKQSIESILNQTYKDFEYIIILDNPENQKHIQLINEYAKKDQRIRFYINDKNMGIQKTANRGLSLAKGKYICRMDADDISLPDRIEKQIAFLNDNNYDYIGGATEVIDENSVRLYDASIIPTRHEKIIKALKYNQVISNPTVFAKREVFDKLGGYRIVMTEDYDFTLRAVLSGFKIGNVSDVVLQYRMTQNSISRTNLYTQFLYGKYFSMEYRKGKVANLDKADMYVKNKDKKSVAKRYVLANHRFNQTLNDLTEKKYLRFFRDGIALSFTSWNYLTKIYRFLRASMERG